MIKVENLSKQFKRSKQQIKQNIDLSPLVTAVNEVSFTCQPGRIFSLLGPNGAGKTTTLRMIATILQPSSGTIEVAGHNVSSSPQEIRRKIGFLTGSTGLYQRLTANEIIRYFADLYKVEQKDFNTRKEYLFTLLGINDFANKRIGSLSTGMQQKVSIARTMIHDPEVVIFDEPTSGLDVITAEHIIDLIRKCKKEGKTVIFSSHIMSEVDMLCDDLAILHHGKLCYHSSMETFRKEMQTTNLTEAFIQIVKSSE